MQFEFSSKSASTILLVLLCILVLLQSSQCAESFKMAILIPGRLTDLSWSHVWAKSRVSLHKIVEKNYPDIDIESATDVDVLVTNFRSRVEHWVQKEYNVIVGASFDFQDDIIELSYRYPNVSFIHVTGFLTAGDNFAQVDAKMYQPQYLAGFVAGKMSHDTNHICYVKSFDFGLTRRWFNAYALGARAANPNVQFTVMHVDSWIAHGDKELGAGATRALTHQNCSIIGGGINEDDIYLAAIDAGRLTTGFQTDWAPYIGDGSEVLLSTEFNWEALLLPFVDAVIANDTFKYIQRHQWRGMEDFVCDVSEPSVRVPLEARNELQALRHSFIYNNTQVFCGEIRDNNGVVRVPAGTCLDVDAVALQADPMEWHLEGTTDLGLYRLPSRACGPGTYYTYSPLTNTLNCFQCPAGSYARTSQQHECTPCNANFYSEGGASTCTICPEGEFSTAGSSVCSAPSKWWMYLVISLGAALAVLIGIFCFTVCCFYAKRRYNLRMAPKRGRVVAVMTDIEKSTELHNSLGVHMKKAMAIHNRIMQRNIAKFGGYSPKNLGDGYFIVFSSVTRAVQFCTQTQLDLLNQNWPKQLLDHPLCAERYDESGEYVIYRGLRVRMGCSVGHPQVIYNRLLSTYDYAGGFIAVASRAESCGYGGYCLMTTEVMEEAASNLKNTVFYKENMMKFKGVPEPLRLWSAWEPPLDRRRVKGLESSEKAEVYLEEGDSTPGTPTKSQTFFPTGHKGEPFMIGEETPYVPQVDSEESLSSAAPHPGYVEESVKISVAPVEDKYRLPEENSAQKRNLSLREMKARDPAQRGKSSSEHVLETPDFDDLAQVKTYDDEDDADSAV